MWIKESFVLIKRITVGHAGEVIADRAMQAFIILPRLYIGRKLHRIGDIRLEEIGENPPSFVAHPNDSVVMIEFFKKAGLQFILLRQHFIAECNKPRRMIPDIFDRSGMFMKLPGSFLDEIGGQRVDEAANGLVYHDLFIGRGCHPLIQPFPCIGPETHRGEAIRFEHPAGQAVVDIMCDICDLIGEIDNLGFDTRRFLRLIL